MHEGDGREAEIRGAYVLETLYVDPAKRLAYWREQASAHPGAEIYL